MKKILLGLAFVMLLSGCPYPPETIIIENKTNQDCPLYIYPGRYGLFFVKKNQTTSKTIPFGHFIELPEYCKKVFLVKDTKKITIFSKKLNSIVIDNQAKINVKISPISFSDDDRKNKIPYSLFSDVLIEANTTKTMPIFYNDYTEIIKNGIFLSSDLVEYKYIPLDNKIILKNKEF